MLWGNFSQDDRDLIKRLEDRLVHLESAFSAESQSSDELFSPPNADEAYVRWLVSLSRNDFEQYCARQLDYKYLGDRRGMVTVLGRYQLLVPTDDYSLSLQLIRRGYWEPWITLALGRLLKPGMTAVDVGANVGYYTAMFAAAVGSGGRVFAVEALPDLAGLLNWSMKLNGFGDRVTVVEALASDKVGETRTIARRPHEPMNTHMVEAQRVGRTYGENIVFESMVTTTLDVVCADAARVDLIKIDAEGSEKFIWYGMQEIQRRNPDITMVMEFNRVRYDEPDAFLDMLEAAGWPLRYIDYNGEIRTVDRAEMCRHPPEEDWLLVLRRG